ncbi:MAG: outer membrane beta-barrel protein [Gemmatimonadaceae bacterium]
MYIRAAALGLLLTSVSTIALSQRSGPGNSGAKGFFLGLSLHGSSLTADDLDSDTQNGGGLQLQLGWGFTPKLAIFLDGSAASMDSDGESWILSHGDLGLRYHFASPGKSFVPFVEGAFTGWVGSQDDVDFGTGTGDLEISGAGFTLGGGFLYFFNSRVALNAGVKWTKGEFDKVTFENVSVEGLDIDATSARLNLGITWFLGGTR